MTKKTIGVLLLILASAFTANSQQATPTPQPQPTTTTQDAQPASTSDYVFPTKEERLKRYVNSMVGPFRLARTGVAAGIDQWRDSPEEWGQGASGYGKRYASQLGRNAIHQTITYSLDEALRLDTGFQRSKRDGFFPRLKDALLETVTSRTRSGKRVISVPRLVGAYTAGVVAAETWYPDRYSYKDGLRHGTRSLLTGFGLNVFREFVIDW